MADDIRTALYADENERFRHITIDKALADKARGISRRYKCPGLSEKCLADVIPVREGVTYEGTVFPAHFREAKHGKKHGEKHGKKCEYDSKITVRRTPSADPKLLSLKKLLDKASKEESENGDDDKKVPYGTPIDDPVGDVINPEFSDHEDDKNIHTIPSYNEDDDPPGFDKPITDRPQGPRTILEAYLNHVEGKYGDDVKEITGDDRKVRDSFYDELTYEYFRKYPENLGGIMIVHTRMCNDSKARQYLKSKIGYGWLMQDVYPCPDSKEKIYFWLTYKRSMNEKIGNLFTQYTGQAREFLVICDWKRVERSKYHTIYGEITSIKQIVVLEPADFE